MLISPDRRWRNISQHNEPVRPAGVGAAARTLVLAGLGCGVGCRGERRWVCWLAANIYGQETAALADSATAQDLVNLQLVAPTCDTRMVGGAPRALTRLSRMGGV